MRTSKPSLIVIIFFLSISFVLAQSGITWQLHHGQGEGIFVPGPNDPPIEDILNELTNGRQPVHGDPGGFQYATIPPVDDQNWESAPTDEDGDLCWRLNRSILSSSFTALDFTYFQTVINVTNTDLVFTIRYLQVDDGVRAYVFNSAYPEGAFIEGGDARLYATPLEIDLSPLFVLGANRIVLVQFDDSATQNFMKARVIREEDAAGCENDTEAPRMFGILADGSEVPISELIQERYDCGNQPFLDVKAVDNCDPNPAFNQRVDSTLNEDGTSTITLQFGVRDRSGNENREIYTYINNGEDREAPQIVGVLPDGTEAPLSELIQDRFDCNEQPFESIIVVDNCDPEPLLETVTTFSPNPDGSQSITIDYTVTDASGNTNREVYSYVDGGEDLKLPSISRVVVRPFRDDFIRDTIPITEDFRTDTFPCTTTSVALPYDELIVEDNCDPDPDVSITIDSTFAMDGSLVSTLTITAEDINGNINQKRYTYVILPDTEGPELNCSLNAVRLTLDDSREFIPTKENLNIFAFDACGGDISYKFEPAVVTRLGSNIVKVSAQDAKGNISICNVEVFIEGLPCDLAITNVGGRAASCLGDATGSLIVLASSSGGELEYSIDGVNFQSGNVFENLVPQTYEIIAREVNNPDCIATETFTIITDTDNESPKIFTLLMDGSTVPLSEVIQARYSCGESPYLDIKTIDDCDPNPNIEIELDSILLADGSLQFNLTVIALDANNNQQKETYQYNIIPDEAPQIVAVLADGSEVLLSETIREVYSCGEQPFVAIKAIDDCDAFPDIEVILDSVLLADGSVQLNLAVNATDTNNNQQKETYQYNIIPDEAPQIFAVLADGSEVLLSDIIQEQYDCSEQTFEYLIAIDDCDPNPKIEVMMDTTSLEGTLFINLTINTIDTNGNSRQEAYEYSIVDVEAPQIFALSVNTIEENGQEITIRDTIPFSDIMVDTSFIYPCSTSPLDPYSRIIAIDNCDANVNPIRTSSVRSLTEDSGGNNISVITVKYTASDASGNSADNSISYLSASNSESPIFVECPRTPIVVNLNDLNTNVFIPTVGENIPAFAEDSCDGQELTYTYEPAEITEPGVYQIEIIAIDSDGNESEPCNIIVNVIANISDSPEDAKKSLSSKIDFESNIYPNPFQHQTNLQINLTQASDLEILIRDINGKVVYQMIYDKVEIGQSRFQLDLERLNQGIYFLSVKTANTQQVIRLMMIQ